MALRNNTRNSGCPGVRQTARQENFIGLREREPIPWDEIINVVSCSCEYQAQQTFGGDMIFIQGGTFEMGCEYLTPCLNCTFCEDDELPVHDVILDSFYICKYEITQADWLSLMSDITPSDKPYFITCGDECPMENISWYDAVVYCNRLSDAHGRTPVYYSDTGHTEVYGFISGNTWELTDPDNIGFNPVYWDQSANGYRLPTEAEWEYAARGGAQATTTLYAGGNNINDVAWWAANSGVLWNDTPNWQGKRPRPVGGKQHNELGLYDMSGNIMEWVWDASSNYPNYPIINPTGPTAWNSKGVLRGGFFGDNEDECEVFSRAIGIERLQPHFDRGFRIAANESGGEFIPQTGLTATCYNIDVDISYFESEDITDVLGNIVGSPTIYYGIAEDGGDRPTFILYSGEIEYDEELCGKTIIFRIKIEFDSGYCINGTYSEYICCCEDCNQVSLAEDCVVCSGFTATTLAINTEEDVPYQIMLNGEIITYTGTEYLINGVETTYPFLIAVNDSTSLPGGWGGCAEIYGNVIHNISPPYTWEVIGYNCMVCPITGATSECSVDVIVPVSVTTTCNIQNTLGRLFEWFKEFDYISSCDCCGDTGTLIINPSHYGDFIEVIFEDDAIILYLMSEEEEITLVDFLDGICNSVIDGVYIVDSERGCFTQSLGFSTFTIQSLEINCPESLTVPAACNQDDIDTSFNEWIGEFSYVGGFEPITENLLPAMPTSPPHCGGVRSVDYTVFDISGFSANCMSVFTVEFPSILTLGCPDDIVTILTCSEYVVTPLVSIFTDIIEALRNATDAFQINSDFNCPISATTSISLVNKIGNVLLYDIELMTIHRPNADEIDFVQDNTWPLPPINNGVGLFFWVVEIEVYDACGQSASCDFEYRIPICNKQELACPPDILATDRLYPSGVTPTGAVHCGGDSTTGYTGIPIKYEPDCGGYPTLSYIESFASGHWYWGDGPPPIITPGAASSACTYTILRDWSITDTCDTEFCPQIIHVDRSIISASSYNFLAIHPPHVVIDCGDPATTAVLGLAKLIDYDTDTLLFSAGTAYNGFDCNILTKSGDGVIELLCGNMSTTTGPRVLLRTFDFFHCADTGFSEPFTSAYQRITFLCSACTVSMGYCDNFYYSIKKDSSFTKFTVNNIVTQATSYKFQLSGGATDTIEYDGSIYKLNGSAVTLPFDISAATLVDWTLVEYDGIPVSNLCIRV